MSFYDNSKSVEGRRGGRDIEISAVSFGDSATATEDNSPIDIFVSNLQKVEDAVWACPDIADMIPDLVIASLVFAIPDGGQLHEYLSGKDLTDAEIQDILVEYMHFLGQEDCGEELSSEDLLIKALEAYIEKVK